MAKPKGFEGISVRTTRGVPGLEMPQFTLKDRKENYKSHGLEDFLKNHPSLLGVKGCVSMKGRSRATNKWDLHREAEQGGGYGG